MADCRIPKDLLYGELVQGNCPRGRPQLRFKDICKRDLKALGMNLNRWETLTSECSAWRQVVHHGLSQFEETLVQQAEAKRQSRNQQSQGAGQGTDCICLQCGRDFQSQIGLLSHTRCSKTSIQSMSHSFWRLTFCTRKDMQKGFSRKCIKSFYIFCVFII